MPKPATPGTTDTDQAAGRRPVRRTPIRRSIIVLAIATVALAVFILALGDLRRRNMALDQAGWYASKLAGRLGEARTLPLNLEIDVPQAMKPRLRTFQWLTREEAYALRTTGERFIVAQTDEVLQVLGANGRAVVFFDAGELEPEWLTRARFDGLYAAQREGIPGRTSNGGG